MSKELEALEDLYKHINNTNPVLWEEFLIVKHFIERKEREETSKR